MTAERQAADTGSKLMLYCDALRLRRELPALGEGPLEWLETAGDDVLAFRRDPGFVCVVNLGDAPAELPASLPDGARVLLASAPLDDAGRVPGSTAIWFDTGPPPASGSQRTTRMWGRSGRPWRPQPPHIRVVARISRSR